MKVIFTILFTIITAFAFCQPQPRRIMFRTLGKDSINLHMDENYALIEDSCSTVIRYGHLRMQDRKFIGTFRDLNKYDPSIVLAEGRYTNEGQLDGHMIMNYLNGEPLAEGTFDKGIMTGKWIIYYPGNKKRLEFENNAGQTRILNAWDISGKQTVIDGSGTYRSDLDMVYWEGKLVNGRPDGVWRGKKHEDRTGTVLVSETFKNGSFVKGSGPIGNYTDESRIVLAGNNLTPITKAGLLMPSPRACGAAASRKKTVLAVYKDGNMAFMEAVKTEIQPVFAKVDLNMYPYKTFQIKAGIDSKGKLTSFHYVDGWEDRQASALIQALSRLPYLEPTLVDGQPVASEISFNFKIDRNLYTYSFRITPIK
ncbi:toxin-antitoxin system YwqK family antitoxin [Daejeonella lutea]|uniref:MORN repeat variant n=1 Tax=Daejeonella lutea TaxID=572036 RepID=A0A1T5AS90_9SPHI|nr:hypothetical protein [Daejeonella lutea]SKB37697.1 hypothetical protein SAMN05661099_0979 [Daejeonella lutea]